MSKKKCKHQVIQWLDDGDKRARCKKCGKYFVIVNGILEEL